MKRIFIIGTALLFTVFAGSVFAQDAGAVTLTEQAAVDYALKNSHQLKSGAIDLEIKKRADDNSWNTFLPSVTASGTMSRANEVTDTSAMMMSSLAPLFSALGQPVPAASDPTESDHWRIVGNIGISWNFSVAMLTSMKATHANYEAGLITWEQTLKQTERDVRKLFYGMLLAQESLKLNEASLENAKSRADQTQANYRNGRAPELSLLQAQVAYENKKPDVLKAQQALEKNLDTFALLLGMDAGTKLRLEGSISPDYLDLDAEQLIQKNLSSRLDVQALQKNIELLSINKKALDLSAYTPSLSLSWGWQPVAGMTALKDGAKDPWTDNGSLSITLAWNLTNLIPWSAQRQQAKDLDANISKLRLSSKALTDQATSEITALVKSLELSRTQIEAMQRNIDLAQRAYDMTQASYRNGTTELLDVRDAETSLNQAKLGLLNEQYNYLSGVLDLEYAVNTKLGK